MAEPGAQVPLTLEERAEEKRRAREASFTVPEMSFDLAPGDYSGYIGEGAGRPGGAGRISVPSSGKFRTTDAAEQAFLQSLGYEGTLTRSGQKEMREQAQEQEQQAQAAADEEA